MSGGGWYVYVLECEGGKLYTGISTDTLRRFHQHVDGKGARYTRAHRPQRVLINLPVDTRSLALRIELAIKRLSPAAKRRLCVEISNGNLHAGDIDLPERR